MDIGKGSILGPTELEELRETIEAIKNLDTWYEVETPLKLNRGCIIKDTC